MPTILRKSKAKSQAKIYERAENIYPEGYREPVATKEFVRQELRAELSPIRRDIRWLMLIVSSLAGLTLYLHSDTKQDMKALRTDMKALRTELKADMRELKADIDKRFDKMEKLLQRK